MICKPLHFLAAAGLISSLAAPAQPPAVPVPPFPSVSIRIVASAPPPPRPPVVITQPAPEYVWSDGYWDSRGTEWTWVDGRWDRPPGAGVTWVKPQYERVADGWRYVPAHWSNQEVVAVHADNGKHKGWHKAKKVKYKKVKHDHDD